MAGLLVSPVCKFHPIAPGNVMHLADLPETWVMLMTPVANPTQWGRSLRTKSLQAKLVCLVRSSAN